MLTLALEFSSDQRSAAVVRGASVSAPALVMEVVETGGQATKALGLIDQALRAAHVEREQIECIAIGIGPGSYTGIRAAIALAQGWQLANGVKLLGVSSVVAMVAQAHADALEGRVAVVIDAQRREYYLANYELGSSGWRETRPLGLASASEVQECEASGARLIGPEVTRWFPSGRVIFPRAVMVGRLALGRSDFVAGEELEPIYLRETTFVKAPPPRKVPL